MITATYSAHMGDDIFVVNKARVSFAKHTDTLRPRDIRLLHYLARNGHWTPFAHPHISLTIRAPIFVARQCFRHKIGFIENEVSRRYVDDQPVFYTPILRARAPDKKQGSQEEGLTPINVLSLAIGTSADIPPEDILAAAHRQALDNYNFLLKCNVAPEHARMVLPQSTLTEWAWTGSLAAWARFHSQRTHPNAQEETRYLASLCADIIAPLFPYSWQALTA